MDATTEKGMRPEDVAERCLVAVYRGEADVLMAEAKAVLACHLRYWAPALLTRIMTGMASTQRKELKKAKGASVPSTVSSRSKTHRMAS